MNTKSIVESAGTVPTFAVKLLEPVKLAPFVNPKEFVPADVVLTLPLLVTEIPFTVVGIVSKFVLNLVFVVIPIFGALSANFGFEFDLQHRSFVFSTDVSGAVGGVKFDV